jgi:8-oxo-dGTP diphosphatase
MAESSEEIQAGGAVVLSVIDGREHVLVVHRPHRSDWSLPKGKLEAGESHDVAAVREVLEETGVHCALGPFLGTRSYEVAGQPKTVHYWRATVSEQKPHKHDDEVDDVRWVDIHDVENLLTYPDDRELVARAAAMPSTHPLIILRHAEATKRAAWRESGDPTATSDKERPLNDAGELQAQKLERILSAYGPTILISSDARRCRSTVEPFSNAIGLPIRSEHALSEEGFLENPDTTAACVERLLAESDPAVWCTHRPVLPAVTRALNQRLHITDPANADRLDPRLKPSAALILHLDSRGEVVQIDTRDAVDVSR